ncbi:DUF3710 domain-containing protein [Streptomyces sp. RB17]|uniref:DUF3710 domain-containing protein n=1 Tax=Streptomyces sp. RB17 TaxID=2585197 RepID=UPI00188656BA|nr:DUF3710 domain-containing protein [Streptomyces sp. RB17]
MSVESIVWQLITEFRRSGSLNEGERLVDLDDSSAIDDLESPAVTVFAAAQVMIRAIWEEEHGDVDRVVARVPARELSRVQKVLLIQACLGDIEAVRSARDEHGVLNIRTLVTLLCSLLDGEGVAEAATYELLAPAVGFQGEALRMVRSGDRGGPRDVTATASQVLPAVDLGGLRIPGGTDFVLHAVRSEGRVCGVTVVRGSTALQLQAFHAIPGRNWDVIRGELHRKMVRGGGSAKEWSGPAGVEVRANVPTTRPDGSTKVMRVRFLGHDGPDWLLRGVVTGAGAAPESADQWAYRLFASTVVVPSFSPRENGVAIALNIPDAASR